jgi:hypothetical protein
MKPQPRAISQTWAGNRFREGLLAERQYSVRDFRSGLSLLLLAFAGHEGRKSLASLAIVLGVVALIACAVYGLRALGIS